MDLLDRLRLDVPVAQAGMGGGLAGPELAAGVAGVVAGTRFLLTDEARAHPGYQRGSLRPTKRFGQSCLGSGGPPRIAWWPMP
jgi:NAD(P)H-dependent flavin oxidoreductase YrpB (nitropropane dioxygenase family)